MQVHGLRPLSRRDRLLWERVLHALAAGALWVVCVLWLLSRYIDIGLITVLVVACLGVLGGFVAMAQLRARSDLSRWPRAGDGDG